MNNEGWCKENCPYNTDCSCDGVCNFILSLLKEKESTINELQNAYGYLQKQFFEAQDKLKMHPLAEEVVRCRECKHYHKGHCMCDDTIYWYREPDWFCADGEPKE